MLLRLLRFACIALAAATTVVAAQPVPPGVTMHRLQAGEPDASGWMLAASTKGGFSVKLPLRFNDFAVADSDPASPTPLVFAVGTKSSEGIKFSATRLTYRKGAQAAQEYFTRFERGADFNPKPERITKHKVGERPAVDLLLGNAASVSYQRAVLLGADLLLLIVEAPREHAALAQQFAQPFFDSLAISAR